MTDQPASTAPITALTTAFAAASLGDSTAKGNDYGNILVRLTPADTASLVPGIDSAATARPVTWGDIHEYLARIQAERVRRAQAAIDAFVRTMAAAFAPAAERACRDMSEAAEALRHLPEAEGCNDCSKPTPPRDRPAWQSPYGPARRRR